MPFQKVGNLTNLKIKVGVGPISSCLQLGIQYGVSRKGRILLADDMGLGKTVQEKQSHQISD
jgi:hypothetical protein